jgi:hypothetical protein
MHAQHRHAEWTANCQGIYTGLFGFPKARFIDAHRPILFLFHICAPPAPQQNALEAFRGISIMVTPAEFNARGASRFYLPSQITGIMERHCILITVDFQTDLSGTNQFVDELCMMDDRIVSTKGGIFILERV